MFDTVFSKHQPLLTFRIHAYITQTAQVPKLLDGHGANAENFNPLGRAQQRHRRQTQTDGSCHKAKITQYSSPKNQALTYDRPTSDWQVGLMVIRYCISVLHPLLYNLFEIFEVHISFSVKYQKYRIYQKIMIFSIF